jgi:hypothetical protein
MSARRLAWVGLMALAGCYNPHIEDGTLKCSATSECPSGFKCNPNDGRCYSNGGGPSAPVDSGSGGGVCAVGQGAYGPFAGCTAQIQQTCDPVCQAGCACDERCMADKGVLVCKQQSPPFKALTEECDSKADTCRPGLICLVEDTDRPACSAHCYRHCRNDSDCQSISAFSKCSIEVAFSGSTFTAKTCTPAPETCNPWGAARCKAADRPAGTFACYVISGAPDQTTCECAGLLLEGKACMYEHDCVAGLECVAVAGNRICRKVCAITPNPLQPGSACATGVCTPFSGSTKYGYCL